MFNRLLIETQDKELVFCSQVTSIRIAYNHQASKFKYEVIAKVVDYSPIVLGRYETETAVNIAYRNIRNFLNCWKRESQCTIFKMPMGNYESDEVIYYEDMGR